ncbi:tetratricopeptide repeat protein [Tamlana sp. 2_MG-2023]|uniref:tetratricopeptide repeat protein n=1 Tax=unclassified Tamlana TaxID=2614803 RepID=UPI0026E490C1|nr:MULTISPECIES: tetratricopeptide repeat protein [unclassified Tamlana]MDO6759938.1 tetratricopeptide repeat protein [Tamlana sp. 2_MG-2023]MDO6791892.1 tetratricopeptide repeat protein [Tamlana sp. 1_MG-2023]
MKTILYLLSFLLTFGVFAQNEALFEKGNAFYNDGKYAEAIDNYQAILESGVHSADLYFNLANANYKLNNIAPSIYYYEKALLLEPNDSDIKNNLAYAENMTVDAIDVIPEAGIAKLIHNLTDKMTSDGWAITAICFVFVFVILFLVYHFSYSTTQKRLTFVGSLTALTLMCITLTLAFHKYNLDKKDNPAIVFVQESKVKTTPNAKSEEAFRLHEGTKVQVVETYNDWQKIKLADGKIGWVISEDIKMLKEI